MQGYVGSTLPGPDGNKTAILNSRARDRCRAFFSKIISIGKKDKVTVGEIA